MPGLVLVPAAAAALRIPMIASGGFADGRGLAAALALGAEGISMGTRFVATAEADVHANVKRADERSTELIFRQLRNTARVATNAVSADVVRILGDGGGFPDVAELVAGERGVVVLTEGDLDAGLWWVGQSRGLVNDVPTVAELVARIVAEAEAVIGRLATLRG